MKGESAFVYKDEIGSRVTHVYTIQNNGPWHVPRVNVKIDWPFQVANNKEQGKWLLYLDERPTIEGNANAIKIKFHIFIENVKNLLTLSSLRFCGLGLFLA